MFICCTTLYDGNYIEMSTLRPAKACKMVAFLEEAGLNAKLKVASNQKVQKPVL